MTVSVDPDAILDRFKRRKDEEIAVVVADAEFTRMLEADFVAD